MIARCRIGCCCDCCLGQRSGRHRCARALGIPEQQNRLRLIDPLQRLQQNRSVGRGAFVQALLQDNRPIWNVWRYRRSSGDCAGALFDRRRRLQEDGVAGRRRRDAADAARVDDLAHRRRRGGRGRFDRRLDQDPRRGALADRPRGLEARLLLQDDRLVVLAGDDAAAGAVEQVQQLLAVLQDDLAVLRPRAADQDDVAVLLHRLVAADERQMRRRRVTQIGADVDHADGAIRHPVADFLLVRRRAAVRIALVRRLPCN